ncbi:hypothetical protein [Micromonospora profundi]
MAATSELAAGVTAVAAAVVLLATAGAAGLWALAMARPRCMRRRARSG